LYFLHWKITAKIDTHKVKRLEEENYQYTKNYQDTQRKINETQGRLMLDSTNSVLITGFKKDASKVQKELELVRNELKKLNSIKAKEEQENNQIIEDYKLKVFSI